MRLTKPSPRDAQINTTKFESLTPEMLSSILANAARGQTWEWSDFVDRMLGRDAQILATYETRLSVVSASELCVDMPKRTHGREAHALLACALVSYALDNIPSLSTRSHESLDAIGRGLAAHEIVWEHIAELILDGMLLEGLMLPSSLEWVAPRRLAYDKEWAPCIADLGGDTGYDFPGPQLASFTDRFLVHEPRAIPGYPTGGVFRPIAWVFLIKSYAMSFWVQGAESFAWPFKVARVGRGADAATRAAALKALEELSVNHAAVVEGDAAGGTVIELIESSIKDGGTWRELIANCDAGISTAVLGMTDLTAPSRIGSYNAVETRKGATVDARIAKDAIALASSWERGLVEPILRRNIHLFGGVMPPMPRLRWAIPSSEKPLDVSVIPYATIDEVRASAGLPPLPNGAGEALTSAAAAMPAEALVEPAHVAS